MWGRCHAVAGLLLFLLASEASAATKLIAVLPLDVRHTSGHLNADAQASIEEMLRDLAANTLRPNGWTVLSGENMLQVLQDNGVDVGSCGDESCHLTMAREIKTEAFISGAVQYVDGEFTASIRLIETATGSILASERVAGRTVAQLRHAFEAKGNDFFVRGGLVTAGAAPTVENSGPQVHSSPVTASLGRLTVTARPKEQVRLELFDPAGKQYVSAAPYENAQATPGRWRAKASASGYEEVTQEFDVPADDITLIKFELKLLGGLSITGEPVGAAVTVTGPGGFQNEGGLPWSATGLKSGTYHVQVSRKGYFADARIVAVEPGKTVAMTVSLQKGDALGDVGPMVLIPGGTFVMGLKGDMGGAGRPTRVKLSPYLIDKLEVSVARYKACVEAKQCAPPKGGNACHWEHDKDAQLPIDCVTWEQAAAFCKAQGGRLPTEAEWEFAARGTDGRLYPWGNSPPDAEHVADHPGGRADPVDSHPAGASPFGLLNMAGNVAELVADAYADYPGGYRVNPLRTSGRAHIARGGHAGFTDEYWLRTTSRWTVDANETDDTLGFRCARDAPR